MKKTKYEMVIYLGDNMLETAVDLTAKEYGEKLKDLLEQHHAHCDITQEFYTEHRYQVQEYEKHTCYMHVFEYGVNAIYLYKRDCKDGYKWK